MISCWISNDYVVLVPWRIPIQMIDNQCLDAFRNTIKPAALPIQTAVILAAGRGVRLEARGKLMPKGCLRIGDNTLVEESILRLLDVGIKRIVIITGHLAEQYEPLRDQYIDIVELVHNPHFADSGTLYSLYCAHHCVEESFLLLEADILYESLALTTCLDCPSENVVLLSGFSDTSDECFVETQDGQLRAISKNRDVLGSEVLGEMVGISKISASLFALMLDTAEQRFSRTRHLDYEMDWLVSAAINVPILCPVVEDLVWCEIDDDTHLYRAINEIHPALHQRGLNGDQLDSNRRQSRLGNLGN